jgi:hypothetical protein
MDIAASGIIAQGIGVTVTAGGIRWPHSQLH